jgi:hypothetical protein
MRKFILTLVFVSCAWYALYAQADHRAGSGVVYNIRNVDQLPQFPGDLGDYIWRKIHLVTLDPSDQIQGRFILNFVVMEDGSVSDVTIKNCVNTKVCNQITKIVKQMPRWKPAKKNGKAVSCNYPYPIEVFWE